MSNTYVQPEELRINWRSEWVIENEDRQYLGQQEHDEKFFFTWTYLSALKFKSKVKALFYLKHLGPRRRGLHIKELRHGERRAEWMN